MNISEKGLTLLKHYEGCKLTAYQDSVGIWTIGWGNTYYPDNTRVKQGDTISQAYADELLLNIVKRFEMAVNNGLKVVVKQTQFDALVCLCYNIGVGNFGKSSLLNKINALDPKASERFLLWNKAGGKVVKGLTYRRQSEKYLYDTGEVKFFN